MSAKGPVQLIVGLGNPGVEYAKTRHNVGAWLLDRLVEQDNLSWKTETKFRGSVANMGSSASNCLLLRPSTYMNESGQSVLLISKFYKIPAESILVVHDELDFPAGSIRYKQDGGHGGHNGLRDIIRHLNSSDFKRLRIGIGHPGSKDLVTPYVLGQPSKADQQSIMSAIDEGIQMIRQIFSEN